MIFRRFSTSGNLSVTLIISGVILAIGSAFLLVVLPEMARPATKIWLGDGIFNTEIALTNDARAKGLSGKNNLGPDQAMLLAYPTEGKWGIWMKNMNFPIDIVWLDSDKKVIYIVKNASHEAPTVVYVPKKNAKYVIELPAGTTSTKRITLNRAAVFDVDGEIK